MHHVPGRTGRQRLTAALAALAALLSIMALLGTVTSPARAQTRVPPQPGTARLTAATAARAGEMSVAAMTVRIRAAATAAAARIYTVRSGDSLSAVAVRRCDGQARYWTGIYAASRAAHLTAANANVLAVGQQLVIACAFDARQLRYAPAPPPPPAPAVAAASPASTRPYYVPQRAAVTAVTGTAATFRGSGGEQGCIIARESGGNSQVTNASGHWGLYQFSESTWVAHGGSAADFGRAGVAEQNRVFYSTVAADGYSDWNPYDGC